MRRALLGMTMAVALVVGLGLPAAAETDTVQGRYDGGPIDKLWASNSGSTIVTKVYGDGGRNKVTTVTTTVARRSDGKEYRISAFWYFDQWSKRVSWEADAPQTCDGLVVRWNRDGHYWKFVIPRACVPKLTDTVKVKAEMASRISNVPGATPFTDWLSRG